jgi:hypothetical protein
MIDNARSLPNLPTRMSAGAMSAPSRIVSTLPLVVSHSKIASRPEPREKTYVSFPLPPRSVSFPAPPSSTSSPASAKTSSSPPRLAIVSAPDVPTR